MPTAKKAAVIEELTDKLGRINAAALIEYRGLTVAEIGDLRTQLRQRDVELAGDQEHAAARGGAPQRHERTWTTCSPAHRRRLHLRR